MVFRGFLIDFNMMLGRWPFQPIRDRAGNIKLKFRNNDRKLYHDHFFHKVTIILKSGIKNKYI